MGIQYQFVAGESLIESGDGSLASIGEGDAGGGAQVDDGRVSLTSEHERRAEGIRKGDELFVLNQDAEGVALIGSRPGIKEVAVHGGDGPLFRGGDALGKPAQAAEVGRGAGKERGEAKVGASEIGFHDVDCPGAAGTENGLVGDAWGEGTGGDLLGGSRKTEGGQESEERGERKLWARKHAVSGLERVVLRLESKGSGGECQAGRRSPEP
jgi:hypothetical protein